MSQITYAYQFESDVLAGKFSQVATLTWISYDVIITLGDEIKYIWWSPLSLAKVLYLFTRYFGLARALFDAIVPLNYISDEYCDALQLANDLCVVLVAFSAEILLLIRVIAVWNCSRATRRVVLAACIVPLVLESVWVAVSRHLAASGKDFPGGCLDVTSPGGSTEPLGFAMMSFLPAVTSTVAMCLLMVLRLLLGRRDFVGWTPLMGRLLSDGILYFALVVVAWAFCLAFSFVWYARPAIQTAGFLYVGAVYPIASCRLLLNLRGLIYASRDETTAQDPPERLEMHVFSSETSGSRDGRSPPDSWITTEPSHTSSARP